METNAPADEWAIEEVDEMVNAGAEDVGRWVGSIVRFGLMLFLS
jgi:hypothetical protein